MSPFLCHVDYSSPLISAPEKGEKHFSLPAFALRSCLLGPMKGFLPSLF
jgi:hypothetical protein